MIGLLGLLEHHNDESVVKLVCDNLDLLVQHFKVICLEIDHTTSLEEVNASFSKKWQSYQSLFNDFCKKLAVQIGNHNFLSSRFHNVNAEKAYILSDLPVAEKIIEMRDSRYFLSLKDRILLDEENFQNILEILQVYFRKLLTNKLLQYKDKIKYLGVDNNRITDYPQRTQFINQKLLEAAAYGPVLAILGAAHFQECMFVGNILNRQLGYLSATYILVNQQILSNINCKQISMLHDIINHENIDLSVNNSTNKEYTFRLQLITNGSLDLKVHLISLKQHAEKEYLKFHQQYRSGFFKIKRGIVPSEKTLISLELDTPPNLSEHCSEIKQESTTELLTLPSLKTLKI